MPVYDDGNNQWTGYYSDEDRYRTAQCNVDGARFSERSVGPVNFVLERHGRGLLSPAPSSMPVYDDKDKRCSDEDSHQATQCNVDGARFSERNVGPVNVVL